MKHITEKLELNIEYSNTLDLYLYGDKFAVLDIETTGLSPQYNSVILTGIIVVDRANDELTMHQLFATSTDDEEELILNTIKILDTCDYIITYNGRLFDIPFLEKRATKYHASFPTLFNLDLFVAIKHYSDIPKFISSVSQKNVEDFAGISQYREDRISGGESVNLYLQYMETGSMDLEKRILLHNKDDIKQLFRLMTLLKNVDLHRAFYKTGFPFSDGRITGIELKKADLIIKGKAAGIPSYISFPSIESPYQFQSSQTEETFEIVLPCETRDKDIYVDVAFITFGNSSTTDSESSGMNLGSLNQQQDSSVQLSLFPSYVNDYVILKENGRVNYPEINLLARNLAEYAFSKLTI